MRRTPRAAPHATAPRTNGACGPVAAAAQPAIGPPAAIPPRRTTASSDMTRPVIAGSAVCRAATTELSRYDHAGPGGELLAAKTGVNGACCRNHLVTRA